MRNIIQRAAGSRVANAVSNGLRAAGSAISTGARNLGTAIVNQVSGRNAEARRSHDNFFESGADGSSTLRTHGGQVDMDSAQLNAIKEDAMSSRQEEWRELMEKYMEENEGFEIDLDDFKIPECYLVRGADLHCTHGSHTRKLNQPRCHGVYITKEPMIHKLDCVPGDFQNISSFGVCDSPSIKNAVPLPPTVTLKLVGYDEDGKPIPDLGNVKGRACMPMIAGTWLNVYEETRIVDNGDKDPADKHKENSSMSKGYPAATTESFLVCIHGGIIRPLSSGQHNRDVEHTVPVAT